MSNKFNISDDGSIFSIGNDGTIRRLGKIDSQGRVEGNDSGAFNRCCHRNMPTERKSSGSPVLPWFLFAIAVVVVVVMGINLSGSNDRIHSLGSERSRLNTEVSNLRNENSRLNSEIANMRGRLPVWYQTTSIAVYHFKYRCGQEFRSTFCQEPSAGRSVEVFVVADGWGLTRHGWLEMSRLRRQ